MVTSNIVVEITADNYSIKLSRGKFNLSIMKQLLSQINTKELDDIHQNRLDDDDLRSRRLNTENEIFDRLCDK